MDSEFLKGIINPLTLSLPKDETAKANVVAESIPPERPKTTPLALASFTRVRTKFSIIVKVSGKSFTRYS